MPATLYLALPSTGLAALLGILWLHSTVNFRLLVREKAKIHRSHKRVFNGLVVDIYTMWFNSIVPPLHGFCVCMDVFMTSNLKLTVLCFAGWLSECTANHTAQNNTLWSNVEYFYLKVCIFLLCGVQFTYTLQLAA